MSERFKNRQIGKTEWLWMWQQIRAQHHLFGPELERIYTDRWAHGRYLYRGKHITVHKLPFGTTFYLRGTHIHKRHYITTIAIFRREDLYVPHNKFSTVYINCPCDPDQLVVMRTASCEKETF